VSQCSIQLQADLACEVPHGGDGLGEQFRPGGAAELAARLQVRLHRQAALIFHRSQLRQQLLDLSIALARHAADIKEGVSYLDLVNTEQTLVMAVGNYLNALRDQWTAVVDIAGLLQGPELESK